MKLFVLLVVALIATIPQIAFAGDDQCDIGGAMRHITLPPPVNLNGVLQREVLTPVCWSIRQNNGDLTQMVFFRKIDPREPPKESGQNPGPTVTLQWSCEGDACKILGRMEFRIQTFRQEDIHYRIYGYDASNNRVFSLDSGDTHIDCANDGPRAVYLVNDPHQWHQDAAKSRANFETATAIVVHIDRYNDRTEGLCSQPSHSVFNDLKAALAQAIIDTKKNLDCTYCDKGPAAPGQPATVTPVAAPVSFGPYGQYDCVAPAGENQRPQAESCYTQLGYKTWWVCTGRDGTAATYPSGQWIITNVSCQLPKPPLN